MMGARQAPRRSHSQGCLPVEAGHGLHSGKRRALSAPFQAMPNYDYVCEKCGHEFEVFQSMNDPRLTRCPAKGCRGKVERRIGTGAGFVFKGSGFYITDYRSEGYKADAKKDAPPSDSKPVESKPADAKPADSTAAKPAKKEKPPAKK
jgi:putative FmdB family regulatory protein